MEKAKIHGAVINNTGPSQPFIHAKTTDTHVLLRESVAIRRMYITLITLLTG